MKFSAVLLSYQRRGNIPKIVERLSREPDCSEIIIWDNLGTEGLNETLRPWSGLVRIIRSPENVFTLGRFKAASEANESLIYTQDDDVYPGNIQRLQRTHSGSKGITCYLDESHIAFSKLNYRHEYAGGVCYETLMGYGGFFNRDNLAVLDRWDGDERLLSRKADRIFAMLLDCPHAELESVVEHMGGARSESALYKQPDHLSLTKAAQEKCKQILGGSRSVQSPLLDLERFGTSGSFM